MNRGRDYCDADPVSCRTPYRAGSMGSPVVELNMSGNAKIFERELLGSPTEVMRQFLFHFKDDANQFVTEIASAVCVWEQFGAAAKRLQQSEELTWSTAYFLNAINSILVSTRLLLSGHIVSSGNQVRHAAESLAFAVLVAFPDTGAYCDWKSGNDIEYKALDRLVRNAERCGMNKQNVKSLKEQIKSYDKYSHPSREALRSIWAPNQQYPDGAWNVGAVFVESALEEYRTEMWNRLRLAKCIASTIASVYEKLGFANGSQG